MCTNIFSPDRDIRRWWSIPIWSDSQRNSSIQILHSDAVVADLSVDDFLSVSDSYAQLVIYTTQMCSSRKRCCRSIWDGCSALEMLLLCFQLLAWWYADDSTAGFSLLNLKRWWGLLEEAVPLYGCSLTVHSHQSRLGLNKFFLLPILLSFYLFCFQFYLFFSRRYPILFQGRSMRKQPNITQ